jgi:hypothetical protein
MHYIIMKCHHSTQVSSHTVIHNAHYWQERTYRVRDHGKEEEPQVQGLWNLTPSEGSYAMINTSLAHAGVLKNFKWDFCIV